MTEPSGSCAPLRSEYADDPEMSELVEIFVSELPSRVQAIEEAVRQADLESVTRMAHQLKGAAPGYGYPTIGACAGRLEHKIRYDSVPATEIDQVQREVDELIELCRKAMRVA